VPRRCVICIALLFVVGFLVFGQVSASTTPTHKSETELIRQALISSGIEPGSMRLEAGTLAIQKALARAVWRVGQGKPTYRRAYKLHRVLHRAYLKTYDITVDDLSRIAEDGTFNCLSAVLFFGLAAERLGFETRIIEYPGHLMLELNVRGGPVLIETTANVGFDIQPSRRSYSKGSLFGGAWLVMPAEAAWSVPLEAAVGFTWLNRAWRTFDRGNVSEAVGFVERAAEHVPDLAQRVEAAPRLLARAFTKEYEIGRFDSAYRIATLEETLHPGRVTSQDRLLAAAQKRIEQLCAAGRPRAAAEVREELERFSFEPVALALFDQAVNQVIVSTAVRVEDWELAEAFVEHYAASEPDPIEGERLRVWVDSRKKGSGPVCIELPRPLAMGRTAQP